MHEKEKIEKYNQVFESIEQRAIEKINDMFERRGDKYEHELPANRPVSDLFTIYSFPKVCNHCAIINFIFRLQFN